MTKNKIQGNQQRKKRQRKVTLQKKFRDMQRLFEKLRSNNIEINEEKRKEYRELKNQIKEKETKRKKIENYQKKYQKYKFFELKKLGKKENQIKDQIKNGEGDDNLNKELKNVSRKIQYIKNYPKDEKYISILKEPQNEQTIQKQKEILDNIDQMVFQKVSQA